MENKIRAYIDEAFAGVTTTKRVIELKDELFINLCEKYRDELSNEKTEQEAYASVIAGLGDIAELVDSVKEPSPLVEPPLEAKKRSALLVAMAVGLFIISPFVTAVFAVFFANPIIGVFLMFLCIAVGVGMLIYNGMTKPAYAKQQETIVEDFKQWRSNTQNRKAAYKSLASAYWSIVTAVYLLVSFMFGIWAFSWIIFIIAGAVHNIIKAFFILKEDGNE